MGPGRLVEGTDPRARRPATSSFLQSGAGCPWRKVVPDAVHRLPNLTTHPVARDLRPQGADPGRARGSPRLVAQELYLTWLMALPGEIDAAHAAALVLDRVAGTASGPAARGLIELLETTTAYPRERLDPGTTQRRRLH